MKKHLFEQFKSISAKVGAIRMSLLLILALSAVAVATPSSGILLNQIVAMGAAQEDIKEKVEVAGNSNDLDDDDWHAHVKTNGPTDFYVQRVVLGPGGYSGWHTHPGVLVGTVVSGSIDFYDANCERRSFTAGQVFTENTEVHAIINTGAVNTDLSVAYLIKHNTPRRIEAFAPPCAPSTGIP